MCWSGEASAAITFVGFTVAAFEYRKAIVKDPVTHQSQIDTEGYLSANRLRAIGLIYFSLMELLQAWNYLYIYEPGTMNALGSALGFIHISFQPIPTLLICYSFLPLERRRYWIKIGIPLALIASVLFLMKLVTNKSLPGCFAVPCTLGTSILDISRDTLNGGTSVIGCSADGSFLSYRGEWHIAWQWPMNSCSRILGTWYFVIAFFLPFLAGCYRIMLYLLVMGPVLALALTGNPDEWAAVWCLLSIAYLCCIKIPVLTKFLTVKHESWAETFKTKHAP